MPEIKCVTFTNEISAQCGPGECDPVGCIPDWEPTPCNPDISCRPK